MHKFRNTQVMTLLMTKFARETSVRLRIASRIFQKYLMDVLISHHTSEVPLLRTGIMNPSFTHTAKSTAKRNLIQL
jgi:hypothetical protein